MFSCSIHGVVNNNITSLLVLYVLLADVAKWGSEEVSRPNSFLDDARSSIGHFSFERNFEHKFLTVHQNGEVVQSREQPRYNKSSDK